MTLEKRRALVPAGEVAYVDEGRGPTVLLLHGFPTSSHLWRDLVPILAPRFRALAPDLLGYGGSSKPHDPEALTVRAQATHLRQLLDQLGVEEIAVVGHDIGGGVAQLLALEGVLRVRTMVLIDSIAFGSWPIEGVRMLQEAHDDQVDEEFARGVVGMALQLGMGRAGRLGEGDLEAYLRPWLDDPRALLRAARGIDGAGLVGTEDALASLDVRVLIVWGEDDPYLPVDHAERLGEILPGATVALLPACSHLVTEDAPEVVLPLIADYLRVHHLGERHGHEAGPTPVELGISFERPPHPVEPEE